MRRTARARVGRGRGLGRSSDRGKAVETGETSQPSHTTGSGLDEARVQQIVQQAISAALGRGILETSTPPVPSVLPPVVPIVEQSPVTPPEIPSVLQPTVSPPVVQPVVQSVVQPVVQPVIQPVVQSVIPGRRLLPIYSLSSRHTPADFICTADPFEADGWLRSVEEVLGLYEMTAGEQIEYASFLLKGEAKLWWDIVRATRDVSQMTWADFRQTFQSQYRSADVVAGKIQEFVALQQGERSVRDYANQFALLSSFATALVSTSELRRDRFLHGLRPEIATQATVGRKYPASYEEALERAFRVESFMRRPDPPVQTSRGPTGRAVSQMPPSSSWTPAPVPSLPPAVPSTAESSVGSSRFRREGRQEMRVQRCRVCHQRHRGPCRYQRQFSQGQRQ